MSASLQLIKQLRSASGAPMADCKNAVKATTSLEEAFEWLRKKGLSRAAKLADRVAEQGLVSFRINDAQSMGCLVEVRSETDFVARNQLFQDFSQGLASAALESAAKGDIDPKTRSFAADLGQLKIDGVPAIDAAIALSAKVGEKVTLGRAAIVGGDDLVVSGYAHGALAPGLGTHSSLVALSGDISSRDEAASAAKRVAMHVVAARPLYLDPSCVSQEDLEAERAILQEQVANMGDKPEHVVEKIMKSKLDKFVNERALSAQVSVVEEGKRTVAQLLKADYKLDLHSYAAYKTGGE